MSLSEENARLLADLENYKQSSNGPTDPNTSIEGSESDKQQIQQLQAAVQELSAHVSIIPVLQRFFSINENWTKFLPVLPL